ncbi:MAG: HlyD family efflux transporter periplasmic adaptor subunit [Clostridia bacterium]|nr:HlyD family efflux transporter periplasmic adaptor subunit [Clostridia bacterium]
MNKKIKAITVIILIISLLIVHSSYAGTNKEKDKKTNFMSLSKTEANIGETISITFDLSSVKYDEFEINLSSNISLSDAYIDETNKVDIKDDTSNNAIKIQIDKSKLNLDKITLYYTVEDSLNVGDSIEFSVKVLTEEAEEQESNIILEEEKYVKIVNNENNDTVISNDKDKNSKEDNKNTEAEKSDNSESQKENNNSNKTSNNSESKKESNSNKDSNNKTDITSKSNSNSSTTQSKTSASGKTSSSTAGIAQTVTYKGSNNNYLSNLEIEGATLNTSFNKENTTYFTTVKDVNPINVTATAEDSTAKVSVVGNDSITTGQNKVLISVTAQNGNVRYYRIFVACSEEGKSNMETSVKNKSTTISQTAEIKSATDEKVELHATYYLEEVYVEENQYVDAGTNILKYTNGTYLTAPYNCCIVKLNVPEVNAQCTNSHYVEIESTNILTVSMKVDESNINNISVGKEAKIEISSLGKTYTGYVTHIGSTASNGKFEVNIEFENDGNVKLGMTSTVTMEMI